MATQANLNVASLLERDWLTEYLLATTTCCSSGMRLSPVPRWHIACDDPTMEREDLKDEWCNE